MKVSKLDKFNKYRITNKITTLSILVSLIIIGVQTGETSAIILSNIGTTQENSDLTFEKLYLKNKINETTGLIDAMIILVDVNIQKSVPTVTLNYEVRVNGISIFNRPLEVDRTIDEVFNNLNGSDPILGLRSFDLVIEGWRFYQMYTTGILLIVVSQPSTDNSISGQYDFNYDDFTRSPIATIRGTETLIPYVDQTPVYNSNFGSQASTLIDCECIDYFEFRFEIEVNIPGNMTVTGLVTGDSYLLLTSLPIDDNQVTDGSYSVGTYTLSLFFDTREIYNIRHNNQLSVDIQSNVKWVNNAMDTYPEWTSSRLIQVHKPSYTVSAREFSPLEFDLYDATVSLEYLDTIGNSSIDIIKMKYEVQVNEDIKVSLMGHYVQTSLFDNGIFSKVIEAEIFNFGVFDFTIGTNNFEVNLSTEALGQADLESWRKGGSVIQIFIGGAWDVNITVNSQIIEVHHTTGSILQDIDIAMFPDLFTPSPLDDDSDPRFAGSELLLLTSFTLVSLIILRKKNVIL